MDKGVKLAIEAAGGPRQLAELLGLSRQGVLAWKKVPDKYLLEIEKLVGVDRELLRPDLYRPKK
jgi:DNA-binding transcriptional regulator YdaS (Cro superfamily)